MRCTFSVPKGYKGACGTCDKDDRQDELVLVKVEVKNPRPVPKELEGLMEPVTSIRYYVHKDCRRDDEELT